MTRILVPLDGSELSESALPTAEWLARGMNADVVLLSVGELPETTEEAEGEQSQLRALLDRVKESHLKDLPVSERIDTGRDPVQGIIEAVEQNGIDLIVMSTHGRAGLSEVAQGSVAFEVVRAGVVPVVLVKPK